MRDVCSTTGTGPYQQFVEIGPHHLIGDEGADKGGQDTGPTPHELLLAAVATCTSMTMKAYAQHKGLALRHVSVTVQGRHDNGVFVIEKRVQLEGDLDEAERARIIEIGGRCPVAKTLAAEIRIVG
jgi:putative redox protein